MARRWPIYVTSIIILQLAQSCSDEPAKNYAPNSTAQEESRVTPAEDRKLILAFGDSLYAGYGVTQNESFPHELEKILRKNGNAVDVRNAGVSGETTQGGLQRLEFTLDGLPRNPDLVLLGLGGNDMLRGLSPEQSEENLRAILDVLKARNVPVFLTGMLAAPNMGADYAKHFNAIYPAVAKDYDVPLYPFFLDGVMGDPEYMQADSIHPNPVGIDVIAEKIAPLVSNTLGSAQ